MKIRRVKIISGRNQKIETGVQKTATVEEKTNLWLEKTGHHVTILNVTQSSCSVSGGISVTVMIEYEVEKKHRKY